MGHSGEEILIEVSFRGGIFHKWSCLIVAGAVPLLNLIAANHGSETKTAAL
jgi:hypothetical protein